MEAPLLLVLAQEQRTRNEHATANGAEFYERVSRSSAPTNATVPPRQAWRVGSINRRDGMVAARTQGLAQMSIRYSRGTSKFDAHPEIHTAEDFNAFAQRVLSDRARTKGQQYICAPLKPNGDGRPHRTKTGVEPRRFIALDCDKIAGAETFSELRLWLARFSGFGFTTASSTLDAPRFRVILELDHEVDRAEGIRLGAALVRDINATFGDRAQFDDSTHRGEQPCYGPVHTSESFALDGDPIDVDAVLSTAPHIEPERKGSADIAPDDDPVIVALKTQGMYRRDMGAGRHAIRCPWDSEHTTEDDDQSTATCYMQPHHAGYVTAGFKCLHEHCSTRTGSDLLTAIGVDWRDVRDAYGSRTEAPPEPPEWEPEPIHTQERPLPADILRKVTAPPFEFDDVPECLGRLAQSWGDATGFDRSGIIVAGVVSAAAAMDDRYRLTVRAKSQWHESARLWAVLLAGPSAGKSPTLRAAADPIKRLHSELFKQWQTECKDMKEEDRPPKPALFTSDVTVEALSEILRANERGIFMLTEEFTSWIGSLDAYRGGQGSKDRGEWLQLYDGGPHQIDRVKRGSVLVPNWGASLLAAGTPDGLRKQMKDVPEDGLIHRFIPCIMSTPTADGNGDATQALKVWEARIREVFTRTASQGTRVRARFAFDAQPLFDAEVAELRTLVSALADTAPPLAAHLGKHAGMLARVCLTFHVLDARQSDAVEVDTVQRAIRFMRRVRRHANAMFTGILGAAPAYELARALGRSIVADDQRPERIGRDYMTQRCRAFRAAPPHERRAAVELLEDAGWIRPDGTRTYQGMPSGWSIDSRVFDLFASEGEVHRARRNAVREAFTG